jgi:hypothetical protein
MIVVTLVILVLLCIVCSRRKQHERETETREGETESCEGELGAVNPDVYHPIKYSDLTEYDYLISTTTNTTKTNTKQYTEAQCSLLSKKAGGSITGYKWTQTGKTDKGECRLMHDVPVAQIKRHKQWKTGYNDTTNMIMADEKLYQGHDGK